MILIILITNYLNDLVSKSIYEKYRQLLELDEIAVNTIEKIDEETEFKDKKITVQEDKLKGFDQYDECKINFSIIKLDNLLKEIELEGNC